MIEIIKMWWTGELYTLEQARYMCWYVIIILGSLGAFYGMFFSQKEDSGYGLY